MARHRSVPKLGSYWKAAIAAVSAVGVGIATIAADPNVTAVAPQTATQWLTVVGGGAVAGLLTWLKRNQQTVDQIDKSIDELPLEEVEDLILKYGRKTPNVEVHPVSPDAGSGSAL